MSNAGNPDDYDWIADVIRTSQIESSCRWRLTADFAEAIERRTQYNEPYDVAGWIRRATPRVSGGPSPLRREVWRACRP